MPPTIVVVKFTAPAAAFAPESVAATSMRPVRLTAAFSPLAIPMPMLASAAGALATPRSVGFGAPPPVVATFS